MTRAIILRLFEAMLGIGQVDLDTGGAIVGDGSPASQAGRGNWLENSDEAEMQLNRGDDKKETNHGCQCGCTSTLWVY